MDHSLDKWETDFAVVELLDSVATALAGGDCLDLDDLDEWEKKEFPLIRSDGQHMREGDFHLDSMGTGTMASSHIPIALGDCVSDGQITVLSVHVVGSRTGIVTQPDAEVLDPDGSALVDLLDRHDLTGGLLELLQLTQEIPETGLGDDVVGSEDSHLVERSGRLLLGGQLAPDDFIFLQLKRESKETIVVVSQRLRGFKMLRLCTNVYQDNFSIKNIGFQALPFKIQAEGATLFYSYLH